VNPDEWDEHDLHVHGPYGTHQDGHDHSQDGHVHPGSGLVSPGMPEHSGAHGHELSSHDNPAIGFVIDGVGSYTDTEDDSGFDATLRVMELNAHAWVDDDLWGYVSLVAEDDEVNLEEAAVVQAFETSRASIKAGRFFVDFGKQMQAHPHGLATVNRPLVLREYLGSELGGDGVQFDNWFPAGEKVKVRYSIGAFDSLGGHHHGHEGEDEEEGLEVEDDELRGGEELAFTARLTGMAPVGSGTLQVGTSARLLPSFSFGGELDSGDEATADNLSNSVIGLDLTYGLEDTEEHTSWTFGGELLTFTGDIGGEVDDTTSSLEVLDDDVTGYYLWIDRQLNEKNHVGVLTSTFEHPEAEKPTDSEHSLYWTHHLSHQSRLRLQLDFRESDESEDETALMVQFTNFLGTHVHGMSW